MNIAIVHDDLIQYGGAERLLIAMHEIWPGAPIYTSMASGDWLKRAKGLGISLSTSWMQKLPFKKALFREYFFFYPFVFESFDFSKFDVVISSSTRFAHGVITRPDTLHIAYMNSPGRMLWEPYDYFVGPEKIFHKPLAPFLSALRNWDYIASQRADYFIANSKRPQTRIKKYYRRNSEIIYPFVDLNKFISTRRNSTRRATSPKTRRVYTQGFFLIVSRLVSWKKIDIAIEACNKLKLNLKIVGEGPDKKRLKKLAGPSVEILGRLDDKKVVTLYERCKAFIFPQEEDFGITPLEANASGKPVIAFKAGGALETVIHGKTGLFFYPQTSGALEKVLVKFDEHEFNPETLKDYVKKYSKMRFKQELKHFVESEYEEFKRKVSEPKL